MLIPGMAAKFATKKTSLSQRNHPHRSCWLSPLTGKANDCLNSSLISAKKRPVRGCPSKFAWWMMVQASRKPTKCVHSFHDCNHNSPASKTQHISLRIQGKEVLSMLAGTLPATATSNGWLSLMLMAQSRHKRP